MNKAITLARHTFVWWMMAAVLVAGFLVPTFANAQEDTFGLGELNTNLDLGKKSLQTTVADIINVALGLLGVVAVVIILAGGFKWMTAGGADDKIEEARKLIFSGIVGLAIILSAWAITKFVFDALQEATGSGTLPDF